MGKGTHKSASPADDQDVTSAAASTAETDETSPDSSPGEETQPGGEGESEETMADVIGAALEGKEDGSSESEGQDSEADSESDGTGKGESEAEEEDDKSKSEKEASEESGDGESAEEDDDGSDLEEGQKVPYDRFRKVIGQKNSLKEEKQSLEQQVEQFQEGHQQFQAIQGFMQENGLGTQDVVEALDIAAAINNDPARAMEKLQPRLEQLKKFTGDILPEDLQQRVDTGELSPEYAKEIAYYRNESQHQAQQRQAAERSRQQDQSRQQAETSQQAMAEAANAAQQRYAKADPDYERKAPLIKREVQALIQERNPRTPDEAAQIVADAHDNVAQQLKQVMPAKPEVPRGPSSGGSGSTGASHEPQSMLEAIEQGVNSASSG